VQKLIKGLHQFQSEYFQRRKDFFEQLAHGQKPETLFITCSDSRINPNLLTQTAPGELFILRNAGNLVPEGPGASGEEATIEYAVSALEVRNIILCGHSHCGAMKALLNPGDTEGLPAVRGWLQHAAKTRRIIEENYGHLSPQERLIATTEENVLVQLEQLRALPSVAAAIRERRVRIHGWVYKIESGEVFAYDPEEGQFLPLLAGAAPGASRPPPGALVDTI
jgi:carbonic anhydrase